MAIYSKTVDNLGVSVSECLQSILDFIGAKDEGGGGNNFTGAIRRAKLQSSHH